ncbi:transposase [Leucobacter sp. HY1910]
MFTGAHQTITALQRAVLNRNTGGAQKSEYSPAVHRLFALAKRMIEGTYQGAGTAAHLQEYLDEFVFRFNRRHSTHRGLVFFRLLQRAVAAMPVTYRELVRDSKPKAAKLRGVSGEREKPGTLTALSPLRPWRE